MDTNYNKENLDKFTVEIMELISRHSDEHYEQKMDLFLVVSGLLQAAHQIALRTFCTTIDEGKQKTEESINMATEIIKFISDESNDFSQSPVNNILATIYTGMLTSEFYAQVRDANLSKMKQSLEENSTS